MATRTDMVTKIAKTAKDGKTARAATSFGYMRLAPLGGNAHEDEYRAHLQKTRVERVFEDQGWHGHRPNFYAMLQEARRGDKIVIVRLNQLSTFAPTAIRLLEEMCEAGLEVEILDRASRHRRGLDLQPTSAAILEVIRTMRLAEKAPGRIKLPCGGYGVVMMDGADGGGHNGGGDGGGDGGGGDGGGGGGDGGGGGN